MDIEAIINSAVVSHDWVTLAVAVVVLVVPIVLKAMGKNVPVVDAVIGWVRSVLAARAKKPTPPPAAGKEGVEAVVPVVEKPKPVEDLK